MCPAEIICGCNKVPCPSRERREIRPRGNRPLETLRHENIVYRASYTMHFACRGKRKRHDERSRRGIQSLASPRAFPRAVQLSRVRNGASNESESSGFQESFVIAARAFPSLFSPNLISQSFAREVPVRFDDRANFLEPV